MISNRRFMLVIQRPGDVPIVQYIPDEQLAYQIYEDKKCTNCNGMPNVVYLTEILEQREVF